LHESCDFYYEKLSILLTAFAYKLLWNSDPLPQKEIAKLKEEHSQKKRVKKAMKSFICHVIYMIALYAISFHEREPLSFIYKKNVDNYMKTGEFHSVSSLLFDL
jgi:hypothetical protein